MSDIDKPSPTESSSDVNLTIRMIMNGKEVGSIIGKGGEIINNIREESGAKVHITDGSVPERIVTVTGTTDAILKVFARICKKFEEDGGNSGRDSESNGRGDRDRGSSSSGSRDHHRSSSSSSTSGQVVLRLVVPASQCGSIIGKGGAKIKDIREGTGASIQVASEMLPNSTERAVTLTGTKDSLNQCIYQICCIMLESPAKVTPIPYSPKAGALGSGLMGRDRHGSRHGGNSHHVDNPLASLLSLGSGASTLAALASLAGASGSGGGHHHHHHSSRSSRDHHDDRDNDSGRGSSSSQTYEMSIPNDMIGCIIGKGGSKIGEIRQLSGALIRISKGEEDAGDEAERQITISGNADSVAVAKSLINISLDLHKNRLDERESGGSSSSSGRDRGDRRSGHGGGSSSHGHHGASSAADVNLGLASLLAKPEALTALTTLASLNGLGGLGASGLLSSYSALNQVGGMRGGMRGVYGGNRSGSRDDDRGSRNSKRFKFEPY